MTLVVAGFGMAAFADTTRQRPVEVSAVRAGPYDAALRKLQALPASTLNDPHAVLRAAADAFGASSTGDLLAVLLELQKTLDQQGRDHALETRPDRDEIWRWKGGDTIDVLQQQAGDRYNTAMSAAATEMVLGVAGASVSVAGASNLGQASPVASRPDGGVPLGPGQTPLGAVSPFRAAAVIDVVTTQGLTPAVRLRLRQRSREILSLVASPSRPAKPLGATLRALFASDPVLASADPDKLLPLAIVDAYLAAMDELRAANPRQAGNAPALPLEVAERRAAAILPVLRAMTQQLAH